MLEVFQASSSNGFIIAILPTIVSCSASSVCGVCQHFIIQIPSSDRNAMYLLCTRWFNGGPALLSCKLGSSPLRRFLFNLSLDFDLRRRCLYIHFVSFLRRLFLGFFLRSNNLVTMCYFARERLTSVASLRNWIGLAGSPELIATI